MNHGRMTGIAAWAIIWLAVAPVAAAQTVAPAPFEGVFAFQTDNLGLDDGTSILSGAVVSTMTAAGTYRVELLAVQYNRPATGEQTRVMARQLCSGTPNGEEIVITCQLLETNSANYAPDNFRISRDGGTAVWNGELSGNGAAVVFVQTK